MRIYFTTVVRRVPHAEGGELICLDWDKKQIIYRQPMIPKDPNVTDLNPRGGARGGRGILRSGDTLFAATYHTLVQFDQNLNEIGRISHPLFVGLHEVCAGNNGDIWVTATVIDAAMNITLAGQATGSWWAREQPVLQQECGLDPLLLDKNADNRTLWLDQAHTQSDSHTHLNAVRIHNDDLFVLLNRFGLVINASKNEIVLRDDDIAGAHNLVRFQDYWVVNDTRGKRICAYTDDGQLVKEFDLLSTPEIKAIHDDAVDTSPNARALFVRGLHITDNGRMFVGFSPSTIAEIDFETGRLIDLYNHSTQARHCVHGLLIWE